MKTVKESEAGDLLRVCVYTRGTRWSSPGERKARRKWSTEARKAINERNSAQKLEELILCNFRQSDSHVSFTLSDDYYTNDFRVLKRYWQRFMDRVRKDRQKRGAPALRYLYVIEGYHGDQRMHIHALLPALDGESWAEIVKHWVYGAVIDTPIEQWEHGWQVSRYLSKEARKFGRKYVGQRTFDASRNCERPHLRRYAIPDEEEITVPEGYELKSDRSNVNPYGSYHYYIFARKGAKVNLDVWG